ncbi:MAG: 50S ribosomal protein L10 [Candidatus Promineifilaceae bacterium]
MAITKERKDELVAEYIELLNSSRAIFIAEYTGLNVKDINALRQEVRKAEGAFHVTKNTLLRHALEQTNRPVPESLLTGQVATGFALNEAPALAKALTDFAKNQEHLVIKGGILGPNILTAEQVIDLAKLPSRDELRAQIIGLISAPAQNIASVIAGGVRQVVNVLDAYAKKEGEGTAEAAA